MKRFSNTNTYPDSEGNRWTQAQIKRKADAAKKEFLESFHVEHGFHYCEECRRNDCKPLSVSHIKSEKWAKENGCVELCWDITNMRLLGIPCHQRYDKLDSQLNWIK